VRHWICSACACSSGNAQCSCAELNLAMANARLLDARIDHVGYKMVYFCRHPDGRGALRNVAALLHLQMPGKLSTIYDSEGAERGIVVPAQHGMRAGHKYCVNACVVTGVQFFGQPKPTKEALLDFARNRGFLVSGFGGATKLRYELGQLHVEPRAGQIRNGQRCTEGLHFFIDAHSALNYGQHSLSLSSVSSFPGIVTLRLSQPRGLVFAIEDQLEEEEVKQTAPYKVVNWFPEPQHSQQLAVTRFSGLEAHLMDMVASVK